MLEHWIASVARRTAWGLRKSLLRHKAHEQQAWDISSIACQEEDELQELREELEKEIRHLPHRYREALMLCRMEGNSHAKAASMMGCTSDAIAQLLARGERLLKTRLRNRDIIINPATAT
jgi:DNA-directed RNA polymerase specialized sigma24 family protein